MHYQHLRDRMVGDGIVPEVLVNQAVAVPFGHTPSTTLKGETVTHLVALVTLTRAQKSSHCLPVSVEAPLEQQDMPPHRGLLPAVPHQMLRDDWEGNWRKGGQAPMMTP